MAVITRTLSPLLVYPTEQAALDQFANGNRPHSKDFSYSAEVVVSSVPSGDTLSIVLPFLYLPHPDYTGGEAASYLLDLMVTHRSKYASEAAAVIGVPYKLLLSGLTDTPSVTETETGGGATTAVTGVLETTAVEGWNMSGHTKNHHLVLTHTIAANTVAEAAAFRYSIGIVGTHSVLR